MQLNLDDIGGAKELAQYRLNTASTSLAFWIPGVLFISSEFNVFLRPFFLGLKASGPAILKSFTHLTSLAGLLIPCDKANS